MSEIHPRQLRKLKLFSRWFNTIGLGQRGLIIHLNRRWLGVRTSIAHKGPLRKPGDVNQDPMWNRVKCYYRSHAGWSMRSHKTNTDLKSCGKDSKASRKGQECCLQNDPGVMDNLNIWRPRDSNLHRRCPDGWGRSMPIAANQGGQERFTPIAANQGRRERSIPKVAS